jgi:antitoxin component of MazEF toxin-antitoxin module
MGKLEIKRGLIQVGNSRGIIIPSVFLEALGLVNGDEFLMSVSNGKIVIERVEDVDT